MKEQADGLMYVDQDPLDLEWYRLMSMEERARDRDFDR